MFCFGGFLAWFFALAAFRKRASYERSLIPWTVGGQQVYPAPGYGRSVRSKLPPAEFYFDSAAKQAAAAMTCSVICLGTFIYTCIHWPQCPTYGSCSPCPSGCELTCDYGYLFQLQICLLLLSVSSPIESCRTWCKMRKLDMMLVLNMQTHAQQGMTGVEQSDYVPPHAADASLPNYSHQPSLASQDAARDLVPTCAADSPSPICLHQSSIASQSAAREDAV